MAHILNVTVSNCYSGRVAKRMFDLKLGPPYAQSYS